MGSQDLAAATGSPGLDKRILIIDDNSSIHEDFRAVLDPPDSGGHELAQATATLFGGTAETGRRTRFDLTAVTQGEEGLSAVRAAVRSGKPYAMAFVDVRMPPGWDGIKTTQKIWEIDPDIQVVLCTAFADYSRDEITNRLGSTDRLLILKKPFDAVEVLQLASALTEKWALVQWSKREFQNLERMVSDRTQEFQNANAQLRLEVREQQRTLEALHATLAKSPAVLYSFKFKGESLVPTWISANFTSLVGDPVDEWFRQARTLDYVKETDRPAVREGMKTLLEQDVSGLSYRIRRKDGEIRWIRDDQKLVRDATGHPVEIIGCWTDITEQRLLQEQLWQAQRMESVGQLAGGMAHDFNNTLMVIKGYIEMLLNTEQFKDSVVRSLRQVLSTMERAEHLTQQLLAFSRKQVMRPQELKVNELVSAVGKLLERTLGEHIAVRTSCADNLPCILADRSMIDQVVMNLAINARDSMPKGGELTLGTSVQAVHESHRLQNPDARGGSFICLSVTDNGSGIAKERLPRLFEPFSTTKGEGLGTGLGLATANSIVKQHEGWIEVESQLGRGTTFRVFLPAAKAPAGPTGETRAARPPRGGSETILVVEDEIAVRGLVRTALQRYGYRVCTATSGAEALKFWLDGIDEIDLLITDIIMPNGVSGWELAKQLLARKPELKVLYMSGYNSGMAVKESGLAISHADYFLHKPFSAERLAETVRACMDGVPIVLR
jgi:signal transduction histidine kinase